MNYYRATFQYDGTDYCGFQWQEGMPTIQNELNNALKKLVGGKITTLGASRTDTGVHSFEQIVKISSEKPLHHSLVMHELNATLPAQILCKEFSRCEGSFKPIVGVISKEYRYLFTNHLSTDPSAHRFMANNPYALNIDLMKQACDEICGKINFHNFCSTGSNVKSTEREIFICELSQLDPHTLFPDSKFFTFPSDLKECYQFRIVGNGFLKHMVRHLMSAIWMIGGERISVDEFKRLLNGPLKKKRLWKVASPRGLFLYKINFKTEIAL